MAVVRVLRTYRWIDKDPVVDELRTMVNDEGLSKRLNIVADLASLARTTVHNLFKGETKRPQNATVMAIVTSLGYQRKFVRERKLNIEEELPLAIAWLKRERAKRAEQAGPRKRRRRKVSA